MQSDATLNQSKKNVLFEALKLDILRGYNLNILSFIISKYMFYINIFCNFKEVT